MSTNKKLFGIILLATAGYTSLFFLLLPSPISTTGVLLFIPVATLAWLYGLRIGIVFTIFLLLWQVLILLLLGDRALTTILMSDDFLTAVFISFLLAILIGYIHDLRSQLQVQQQDSKKRVSEQTPLNLPLEEDSLLQFNRLQFAIEESGDGIWDWDIATGDVYFSPQWKTLLGLDDTQMANPLQIWEASIHPEDLPFVQSEMKAYLDGQSDVLMIEYRIKTQESNYIWVLARGKALRDESGKAVRMIGTHSNITKRKRNEDAIYNIAKGVSAATGAQFFQSLVQYISEVTQADTVFVGEFIDVKDPYIQTISVCNNHEIAPNFEYDLQFTPCQNVVGKQVCVYKSSVAQRFPKDIALAEKGIEGYIGSPLFTADGQPLGIIVTLYKKPIQNVNLAQSIIQIFATRASAELERIKAETALRQSEEQLRQAQKMEAVGRLAGGIAHDFNNILTVIISYSDLLTRKLPPEDDSYKHAKHIKEAGEKAASLTHQLLAFSRRQVLEPKIINLNQTILHMEDMSRRLIDENIAINFQLDESIGVFKADGSQLELVIMNLIINAKDAMPNGGILTIATKTISLDEATVKDDVGEYLLPGSYTILTVADTGMGISQESLSRIFEPFFTTKEHGKGTGLGLAMVHGFVKQSGGSVLVDSVVNQGTSFQLYFPVAHEPNFVEQRIPVIAPSVVSGTETVLLVEDEVDVRNITRDILQLFGYNVIVCEAASALSLCQELKQNGNGRIHLLLTDIIMPHMNGYELAQKMATLCPDLKILYMSGYTNDMLSGSGIFKQTAHFIPKPFTPQELTQKVRSVLDE